MAQDGWDVEYAIPDNALDVLGAQVPNCLKILQSRWSGATPPSDDDIVEGNEWWDTGLKRCWDYDGAHWRLPGAPGLAVGCRPTMNTGDANRDTDFPAGFIMADDNSRMMILPAQTKRLDEAYAPGTNQGFLDAGSISANAWYEARGIMNPSTRAVQYLATKYGDSPTMPSGFTIKSPILHWLRTDASSNIRPYDAFELPGGGLEVCWRSLLLDTSGGGTGQNIGTSSTMIGLAVPPVAGMEVLAAVGFYDSAAGGRCYVTSPHETDAAIGLANLTVTMETTVADATAIREVRRRVNANREIRMKCSASTGFVFAAAKSFIVPRRAA